MRKLEIVIYGAGTLGKKYCERLFRAGMEVTCFCDQRACEIQNVTINEKTVPVITVDALLKKENCQVIIGILDDEINRQVADYLIRNKKEISTIEKILYKNPKNEAVKSNRLYIAEAHEYDFDTYYAGAENQDAMEIFWGENSLFKESFSKLDLTNVVELACGHGRHVRMYKEMASHIILVDILEKNINICKKRFYEEQHISYYVNSGYDLSIIEMESQTALFTYDAMVHFEMLDVYSYLKETYRILKPNGMALFHHSNNTESYKVDFATGKNCRNYMSMELFAHLCNRSGLEVVSQKAIDWSGVKDLDGITLVKKSQ